MSKKKPLPKKDTRALTHKFSQDEITEMTDNLTEQMMVVMDLELDKKETAAEFKRKIDRLKEQNNKLARWIHDGEKEQETAVEIFHNWPKAGVKTIVRQDTHDSWEEEMTQWDNTLDNNIPAGTGANDEEE